MSLFNWGRSQECQVKQDKDLVQCSKESKETQLPEGRSFWDLPYFTKGQLFFPSLYHFFSMYQLGGWSSAPVIDSLGSHFSTIGQKYNSDSIVLHRKK